MTIYVAIRSICKYFLIRNAAYFYVKHILWEKKRRDKTSLNHRELIMNNCLYVPGGWKIRGHGDLRKYVQRHRKMHTCTVRPGLNGGFNVDFRDIAQCCNTRVWTWSGLVMDSGAFGAFSLDSDYNYSTTKLQIHFLFLAHIWSHCAGPEHTIYTLWRLAWHWLQTRLHSPNGKHIYTVWIIQTLTWPSSGLNFDLDSTYSLDSDSDELASTTTLM